MPKDLGGQEQQAIYFDHDLRLSLVRLHAVVTAAVECAVGRRCVSDPPLDVQAVVRGCLGRIAVLRCLNEMEVLSSLEILRAGLKKAPSMLIVLDSLGSFYYREKMAEAYADSSVTLQNSIFRSLNRWSRSAIILATKPCLLPPKTSDNPSETKEYLPNSWTKMVNYRLNLHRRGLGPQGNSLYGVALMKGPSR